jgi:hypothetical protein
VKLPEEKIGDAYRDAEERISGGMRLRTRLRGSITAGIVIRIKE